MRRLADGVDALQRVLHGLAFRLRLVGHLLQRLQTARHLIALPAGRGLGRHAALSQAANLLTSAQRHLTRLTHDGLQLGDEAIDCIGHLADLVLTVDAHAPRQIALARRQVIERRTKQAQATQHSPAQHKGDH